MSYSASLTLMALQKIYAGAWDGEEHASSNTFAPVQPTPLNPCGLPSWAKSAARLLTVWLAKSRIPDALFSYPMSSLPAQGPELAKARTVVPVWRGDLSNTQFALLGLWAGTRLGAKVDPKLLASIAVTLIGAQEPKGPKVTRSWDPPAGEPRRRSYVGPTDRARGFGYGIPTRRMAMSASGSMTAGGLSSLLVLKAMLLEAGPIEGALGRRLDRGIWDAIGWLTEHYEVDKIPMIVNRASLPRKMRKILPRIPLAAAVSPWIFYYHYSVERACVIAGKRFLGAHDWYAEGAAFLLEQQDEDGSWVVRAPAGQRGRMHITGMQTPNTCFALLFLKRATMRPRSSLIQTTRDIGK